MHMDPGHRLGIETEQRFFTAFRTIPGTRMPNWFVRMERASRAEDARGIDAFAVISVRNREITVPIQIKCSQRAARSYREKYRGRNHDVLIVVIPPTLDDRGIPPKAFRLLREIREEKSYR